MLSNPGSSWVEIDMQADGVDLEDLKKIKENHQNFYTMPVFQIPQVIPIALKEERAASSL